MALLASREAPNLTNKSDDSERFQYHWPKLKWYFGIGVVRFFISWFAITPAILKLLEHVPERLTLPVDGSAHTIVIGLPFSWWVLWLASLFYTLAFVIYQIRCPSFIKENPDFATYETFQHSPRWLVWLIYFGWRGIDDKDKLADRLIEKKFARELPGASTANKPRVENDGTVWTFLHNNKWFEVRINETFSKERQKDCFWEILARWANSRPLSRVIVWGLLYSAIVATSIVVVQNILFVLTHLLNTIFV